MADGLDPAQEFVVLTCVKSADGAQAAPSPPCPSGWVASTVVPSEILFRGEAQHNANEWAATQFFAGMTILLMMIGFFGGLAINRMGIIGGGRR